ncbi:MAG: pyridoxamine kinase [Oscillospiraceae bacterium]|nr:pyridoxamine kinase [Oscillospiraceae bacterium]
MNRNIRVAAIHDLSGIGRCSLTVILPLLSTMGIQVCPVPTAILSSHTGGFGDVAMRDLTDYIPQALAHYKRLGAGFDCVYSGFLASNEQTGAVMDFFDEYKSSFKVVDPVMADNGKPYRTCGEKLRKRMGELVKKADLITPNVTEAAMLLGEEPYQPNLTVGQMKSFLVRLSEKGPSTVVITSVYSDGKACNIGYDRTSSRFWCVPYKAVDASYPGTGDAFASVLIGSILRGDSLPLAMNRASSFLELAIKTTYGYSAETREGIMIEECLGYLMENPTLCDYEPL